MSKQLCVEDLLALVLSKRIASLDQAWALSLTEVLLAARLSAATTTTVAPTSQDLAKLMCAFPDKQLKKEPTRDGKV